jgi:hypothetical protein
MSIKKEGESLLRLWYQTYSNRASIRFNLSIIQREICAVELPPDKE